MTLDIDHVTVAGSDLDALSQAFASAGLPSEYGGPHSNGVTHMSVIGFDDGTYVELISHLPDAAGSSAFWDDHIRADAGPCAWAIRVDDIGAVVDRLAERGIAVDGPTPYERERPDGVLVEWELAFLGDGAPGATLPFLIEDRTPREYRVQPTEGVAGSALSGIDTVILGVRDIEAATERFERAFDLGAPTTAEHPYLGATVARFPDAPAALAEPLGAGWLADRLATLGPSPCAYLLGSDDPNAAREHVPIECVDEWFGRDIGWVDPAALSGTRLGIV